MKKVSCKSCGKEVFAMLGGMCPACGKPAVEGGRHVENLFSDGDPGAVTASATPRDRVRVVHAGRDSGLDLARAALGILVVTLCYIAGSALHWQFGEVGQIGDVRLPQHLASIAGFFVAARLVRGRFVLGMLIVFAASFVLTGIYEEAWRQFFWSAGYMWDYHVFTLPFWIMAFLVGLLGRIGNSQRMREAA